MQYDCNQVVDVTAEVKNAKDSTGFLYECDTGKRWRIHSKT